MTAAPPRKRVTAPKPASLAAPQKTNGPASNGAANPTPLPAPTKVPDLEHPYGDRKIFVWKPRKGGDPIVLPHISTVKTSQEFFCLIYDLNEMFQGFEWLIKAEVPKAIRLRVAALGDDDPTDQNNMYTAWFKPINRPTGGEPPGES
jgi:hypothetical protein